jgi:predicted nucleic acid-binding protein
MGALILPASGSVYVDSNTVIYAVEKIEPYSSLLSPLWTEANAGGLSIVTSELTWLEVLVKPLRDGNAVLEGLFRAFLTAREVRLFPTTLAIWEEAARIRALGLKTPDAVHAATALAAGSSMFVTNDAAFTRIAGLHVALLSSVATT